MIIGISKTAWLKRTRVLVTLGIICVLFRVIMWFSYEPIVWPDTPTYISLALQIRDWNFSGYLADRTPGYPVLLLFCGLNHQTVWLIQSLMGIAISFLLFSLAYDQSHSLGLSFLIGLSYELCANNLFFEANILSETQSTLFILLPLLLFNGAPRVNRKKIALYISLGVVLALGGLTRPLLWFLVPLYFAFIIYEKASSHATIVEIAKHVTSFILPPILILLGWCSFNQHMVNYFGISTLLGYSLTNHSGAFIELAPVKYSLIRDIYIDYRNAQLSVAGTHAMTIHHAAKTMLTSTGLTYSELSRELTRMSVELFLTNPHLYLKSVSQAWVHFWGVPIYWESGKVKSNLFKSFLEQTWRIEHILLVGINLAFLMISVVVIHTSIVRRQLVSTMDLLIISIVIVASIFQAMIEYGENARYFVPFQPLVVYEVIMWGSIVVNKYWLSQPVRKIRFPT